MTNLEQTIQEFIKMRKSIKKQMTDYAIVILRKKLSKMAKDEETQIEILEQSILNGWQGIFPLKNYSEITTITKKHEIIPHTF